MQNYTDFIRAARAQRNGWFDAEIVPVKTKVKAKDGQEREVLVSILTILTLK